MTISTSSTLSGYSQRVVSFDESQNRNIASSRLGPDERDNSSLKRLIAAGLELLSLPASGLREEEKESEKGGAGGGGGEMEEEEKIVRTFRYFAHARMHASTQHARSTNVLACMQ